MWMLLPLPHCPTALRQSSQRRQGVCSSRSSPISGTHLNTPVFLLSPLGVLSSCNSSHERKPLRLVLVLKMRPHVCELGMNVSTCGSFLLCLQHSQIAHAPVLLQDHDVPSYLQGALHMPAIWCTMAHLTAVLQCLQSRLSRPGPCVIRRLAKLLVY